jgi:hypothetical protein
LTHLNIQSPIEPLITWPIVNEGLVQGERHSMGEVLITNDDLQILANIAQECRKNTIFLEHSFISLNFIFVSLQIGFPFHSV